MEEERLEAQDQADPTHTGIKHGTQRLLTQGSGRKRPGYSSRLGSSPSMDSSNRNCSSREAGGSCLQAGMPLEGGDQWVKSDQEKPLCHGEKAGQGRGGLSSHGLGGETLFSITKEGQWL